MVIDLSALLPLTAAEALRFVANIRVTETGCWLWTGGLTSGNSKCASDLGGYGKFYLRGKTVLAHRVLHTALKGPIADTLDHRASCPRACINPAHTEDVPIVVNILRGGSYYARNARKTHCKRGHALTEENLVFVKGGRMCKACRLISFRAYHHGQTIEEYLRDLRGTR
jgi:hypothetical protein